MTHKVDVQIIRDITGKAHAASNVNEYVRQTDVQDLIMGWPQFNQFMEMVCEKQGEADFHEEFFNGWHEVVWYNGTVHRVIWSEVSE